MKLNSHASKCRLNFLLVMILGLLSFKGLAQQKHPDNSDTIPTISIKGQVTNTTNKAIPAATIIFNKKPLAVADEKGNFSIDGMPSNAQLTISSTGYVTKSLKVAGRTTLRIQLDTSITVINGIEIVSTGYQNIPKERITGSYAKPLPDADSNRKATDLRSKLEAITSGLVINTAENNAPRIMIRGIGSIKANQDPLFVVDNFPYEGDILNIHPEDVESITVLKDAAAASIWGARAGNGVIVITTKRGRFNQRPKVEFSFNSTIQNKPRLEESTNYIPSGDFIDLEKRLFESGYYNAALSNSIDMEPISPVVEILWQQRMGLISSLEASLLIEGLRKNDIRRDIKKHFYRKGINQQYHLGVRGGGEKINYAISLGFDDNNLSLKGNNFRRYIGTSNLSFKIRKNLEVTTGFNFSNTITTSDLALGNMFTGGALGKYLPPYATLTDENGTPTSIVKDHRETFKDTFRIGKLLDWEYIPLADMGLNFDSDRQMNVRMNVGVKYNILKSLNVEIIYQYQAINFQNKKSYDLQSYYIRNLINKFTNISPNGTVNYQIPLGGQLDVTNKYAYSHNLRAQANFNHSWNSHTITAMAGLDIYDQTSYGYRSYYYGYDKKTHISQPLTQSSYVLLLSGELEAITDNNAVNPNTFNRSRSIFGNVSYAYLSRYIFTASIRHDAANVIGSDNRGVPLWSLGTKWNIMEEEFFNVNSIPMLALRFSYGYNGNLRPTIPVQTTAVPVRGNTYQAPSLEIQDMGNSQLSWETLGIFNAGLDFSIFNSRISGAIEFYRKIGTRLIGANVIPASTGANIMFENYAHMQGHGFDLTLNTENIKRQAFFWRSNLLLSHSRDKITHYMDGDKLLLVGRPVYAIYSYRYGGLDPINGNPLGYDKGQKSTNYTEILKTKVIDKEYGGSAVPTWWGGFTNTFTYKDLSLAFTISYKGGYVFRRNSIQYYSLARSWRGHEDYLRRWQKPGDELLTEVPSLSTGTDAANRDKFYSESAALIEKGDHIRFQDIRVSYLLRMPFGQTQFFSNVNNLGIIWRANKLGIDSDYPMGVTPSRSITFGIKLLL